MEIKKEGGLPTCSSHVGEVEGCDLSPFFYCASVTRRGCIKGSRRPEPRYGRDQGAAALARPSRDHCRRSDSKPVDSEIGRDREGRRNLAAGVFSLPCHWQSAGASHSVRRRADGGAQPGGTHTVAIMIPPIQLELASSKRPDVPVTVTIVHDPGHRLNGSMSLGARSAQGFTSPGRHKEMNIPSEYIAAMMYSSQFLSESSVHMMMVLRPS